MDFMGISESNAFFFGGGLEVVSPTNVCITYMYVNVVVSKHGCFWSFFSTGNVHLF